MRGKGLGWVTTADFGGEFTRLDLRSPGTGPLDATSAELRFRENIVRVTQRPAPVPGSCPEQAHYLRNHQSQDLPRPEYLEGSNWLEIWFQNDCPERWGTFGATQWWKGIAVRYDAHLDGDAPDAGASENTRFAFAELEHTAHGPCRVVGLWRMAAAAGHRATAGDRCVRLCLAKAKAFGVKRVVHRLEVPYAQLVGRRTYITWTLD